jgi:DNA-binding Lrp family transcriptional regulator
MSETSEGSEIEVIEDIHVVVDEVDGRVVSEEVGVEIEVEEEPREVPIKVNNKPVVLPKHRMTGLEIKETAIAQGVDIKPDFILTLDARDGKPVETIENDQTVFVRDHDEFTANDGEDNS